MVPQWHLPAAGNGSLNTTQMSQLFLMMTYFPALTFTASFDHRDYFKSVFLATLSLKKHRKIAKSCREHITMMLRCQVVKLFLLKDVTLTTTVTTVTITTITI